ncbi:PREDICTED: protein DETOXIFICATION 6-like [Tarenaya hassleriana]|uniref:protein DETOXIFICATION 6-like n=1 Tax=Tarenaya hassleriana TaxID=28532 RepID=UPI0008FD4766|nr:PREDICTED: protein DETOXIFICATION 6-like [Tarenaya hassleriana]
MLEKEALLVKDDGPVVAGEKGSWPVFAAELKSSAGMAAPLAGVSVAQYLCQVVSVAFAGHIGQLHLSAVAVASSCVRVSGLTIVTGTAGALETLCGQAYGAKEYNKLGTYTYAAIASNLPLCFLVSILWMFIDRILISLGQDPEVSELARSYTLWLFPTLLAHAILQPVTRFLQAQGLVLPLFYSSFASLLFHIPICYYLVFKTGLGIIGAAMAISLSSWLDVAILALYIRFSSSCKHSRGFVSSDFVPSLKQFLRYAIPSGAMTCLEWWLFELVPLISGLLPNPKLETSVLSVCLTTNSLHYVIPYGLAAAGSTRVSNELGAGKPEAAKRAVYALLVLWWVEATILSALLFIFRNTFGYAFSNSVEVINYVTKFAPLLCLSFFFDGFHLVLGGVARGSGWQHLGAMTNMVAYYLVGAPVGALLAFGHHLNAKGLWYGIVIASGLQGLILAFFTLFTNWNEQVSVSLLPMSLIS